MASKREQILAALKTKLTGTTGVAKRIYRSRPEAFAKAETPASITINFKSLFIIEDVILYY